VMPEPVAGDAGATGASELSYDGQAPTGTELLSEFTLPTPIRFSGSAERASLSSAYHPFGPRGGPPRANHHGDEEARGSISNLSAGALGEGIDMTLHGKVAIVTGGNTGIGRARRPGAGR
jgi:hypothetical protein